MKVYVTYTEQEYEGCSMPIDAFETLEDAQASFGPGPEWHGPSVDNEWTRFHRRSRSASCVLLMEVVGPKDVLDGNVQREVGSPS